MSKNRNYCNNNNFRLSDLEGNWVQQLTSVGGVQNISTTINGGVSIAETGRLVIDGCGNGYASGFSTNYTGPVGTPVVTRSFQSVPLTITLVDPEAGLYSVNQSGNPITHIAYAVRSRGIVTELIGHSTVGPTAHVEVYYAKRQG